MQQNICVESQGIVNQRENEELYLLNHIFGGGGGGGAYLSVDGCYSPYSNTAWELSLQGSKLGGALEFSCRSLKYLQRAQKCTGFYTHHI